MIVALPTSKRNAIVVLTIINYDAFGANLDNINSYYLVSRRMKDFNVNMIDTWNLIGHSIKVLSFMNSTIGEFIHSALQTKIYLLILTLSFVLIVGSSLYNGIIILQQDEYVVMLQSLDVK